MNEPLLTTEPTPPTRWWRHKRVWIPSALLAGYLLLFVIVNLRALYEGVGYFRDGMRYEPVAEHPVQEDGPFGVVHELIELTTQERAKLIEAKVRELGYTYEAIEVQDGHVNLFVPGKIDEPFLLLTAHYDKLFDRPEFHAACDNTSSVVLLIKALEELKEEFAERRVAFLFSAMEEQYLQGAYHFAKLARERGYRIEGVVALDILGRGEPALMTSGQGNGFTFRVPPLGQFTYNGYQFYRTPRTWPVHDELLPTQTFGLREHHAFITYTDATAFLAEGYPAVHVMTHNMWHNEHIWNNNNDTVEKLDEEALQRHLDLVLKIVRER